MIRTIIGKPIEYDSSLSAEQVAQKVCHPKLKTYF
jgi:hypothetical protein